MLTAAGYSALRIVPRGLVIFRQRCSPPGAQGISPTRIGNRAAKTPARVTVDFRPLFELAPRHVLLMKLEAGAWVRAALFSADSAQQVFVPG